LTDIDLVGFDRGGVGNPWPDKTAILADLSAEPFDHARHVVPLIT
jgi:hypothetical protein